MQPDRNARKALIQLCKREVTGSIPVRSAGYTAAVFKPPVIQL
jgi:hypothetical protein